MDTQLQLRRLHFTHAVCCEALQTLDNLLRWVEEDVEWKLVVTTRTGMQCSAAHRQRLTAALKKISATKGTIFAARNHLLECRRILEVLCRAYPIKRDQEPSSDVVPDGRPPEAADVDAAVPSAARTTFSLFPCLPPELRSMIWEAAAQPPPSQPYHRSLDVDRGAANPVVHLLADAELWTACRESREAIQRVYRRQRVPWSARTWHHHRRRCHRNILLSRFQDDSGRFVYTVLGLYNHYALLFRDQAQGMRRQFEESFYYLESALARAVSDPTSSRLDQSSIHHGRVETLVEFIERTSQGWRVAEKEVQDLKALEKRLEQCYLA